MNPLILWNSDPEWWRFLGLLLGWIAAFHMPYGERTPYPVKTIVGCTFSLPLLFIGLNPWMVAVPVIFIVLFMLSNWKGFFASTFVWKFVEIIVGVFIGLATAFFIQSNEWLMIACAVVGLVGFAAGGTGFKWARRFVMPFILTGMLFIGINI